MRLNPRKGPETTGGLWILLLHRSVQKKMKEQMEKSFFILFGATGYLALILITEK